MLRWAAAAALAVVATAVLAEAPASRSWRDGPVRYLLTRDEYQRFGRLRTLEARQAWVDRFWRRLDPDPATEANEFRDRFQARAVESGRFREPLTPGWRTDRGRVLLLAGPPSSVRRDTHDAYSTEREIWVYASEATRSRAPVEVVFYRDQQGRFRLEPERSVAAPGEPVQLQIMVRGVRSRGQTAAAVRTFVQTIRDSGDRQRWPADAPRPEPPHSAPPPPPRAVAPSTLRSGTWFFQASDGSVLALFAVDAPADATAPVQASVWISSFAEGVSNATLHVALAPAEDSGAAPGWRRFTGRAYLEPGDYDLRFAVEDGGTLRVHADRLEVPELGLGTLAASSVVPAERFGPAPAGRGSVFAVGSEEVVPRPDATFRRSEPLRLYFQLYGAEPDAGTLRPRVDLRVRFVSVGRRPRRLGDPFVVRGASGASMGLSLPVGNWPPGEYQAEIDLHDRVSGRRATATGRFRIRE